MPLWHERDISHSSVERVALPDAAIATDYLLHLTTGLVTGLVVDAARMRANLDLTGGLIYTSAVLLALVAAGMSREDAYALVQAAAMETWETGTPLPGDAPQAGRQPGPASWTRPRWTRCAAPSATSSGSARVFDRLRGPAVTPPPGAADRRAEAPVLGEGARAVPAARRAAAARRHRPDLGLRPRAAHADPGQGEDPHPALAVVVRPPRRPGAQPPGGRPHPGRVRGPGDGLPAAVDDRGGMRRPRLPGRVGAGRLPADRGRSAGSRSRPA